MGVKLTEGMRQVLSLGMASVTAVIVGFGAYCIPAAYYMKENAAKYRHFITSKDNTFLTMLFVTGILLIAIDGAGAKLFLDCRKVHKRPKVTFPLSIFQVGVFVLIVVVLATAILAFMESGAASSGFDAGFRKAMNKYNTSAKAKQKVDVYQMSARCCGVNGYDDWFKVAWYNTKYIDKHGPMGRAYQIIQLPKKTPSAPDEFILLLDSVPFSCCDTSAPRICKHMAILEVNTIEKSDVKDLSVYERGCDDTVTESLAFASPHRTGQLHLVIIMLLIIVIVISRILQTSINSALLLGDPTATSPAYFFPKSYDPEEEPGVGGEGGGGGGGDAQPGEGREGTEGIAARKAKRPKPKVPKRTRAPAAHGGRMRRGGRRR